MAMRSTMIVQSSQPATTMPGGTPSLVRARRWRRWAILLGLALGLLGWQALWQSHAVPAYMLPAPAAVARKAIALARAGVLWRHVAVTLREALLGFAAAFIVGTSLGYALSRSAVLSAVLAPYVAATQAMPVIAFAPLLVMWFGLGLLPKVIIGALIVFFPILVNTVAGLRSIDRALLDAALVSGANRWQLLWHVEAPLAARTLLAGVKMGLTLAMTGAVVGEFVASDAGLGYLMTFGRTAYDAPMVYVAALTMAAVATFGYLAVSALEAVLLRWE